MNIFTEVFTESAIFMKNAQPCNVLLCERLGIVGAAGFEPTTSCSQSRRATGLRHAPFLGPG